MEGLKKLKVKTKLSLLVAIFIAGFAIFGMVSFQTLNALKVNGPYYQQIVQGKDLVADVLPPPEYIIESYLLAYSMADTSRRGELRDLIDRSEGLEKEYHTRHDYWMADEVLPDEGLVDILTKDSYEPAIEFFRVRNKEFIPAVMRADYTTAEKLLRGPMSANYEKHRKAVDQIVKNANERNARVEKEAADIIDMRTRLMALLGLVIVVISAAGAGYMLNRSIANSLQETIGALSSTSSEIAATIEQHERTAMHQSAAVHETTATMDELDASFTHTADMAQTAADRARQAVTVADSGIQTVRQTLDGMIELKEKVGVIAEQILMLSEQTSQIGTITRVVGDLANQTNMLALNAAVEAARAGEHGKGFGVVASEIRKLADESKKSAERINVLVEQIQRATNSTVMATEEGSKTVDQGIKLAEETVEAFNTVTASSSTASDAAEQTLLSVPQQVTAVRQVLVSMDSLNTGARETADGIGQTKIGVESLRVTALKLKDML